MGDPAKRSQTRLPPRPQPRSSIYQPRNEGSSDEICPISHPYAYLNGNYCCKTKEERPIAYGWTPQSEIDDGTCDGIEFNRQSRCCKDEQYVPCPHASGCYDNTVVTGGCPSDFYTQDFYTEEVGLPDTNLCYKFSKVTINYSDALISCIINGGK